jgi:hypothetical protein
MAYNAGTAFLQVIPSFRDFEKTLGNDVKKMGDLFGKQLAEEIPKAFSRALDESFKDFTDNVGKNLNKGLADAVSKAANSAGDELTDSIGKATRKGMADGARRGAADSERVLSKAAEKAAGAYADAFRKRANNALRSLQSFSPDADLGKAEKQIERFRKRIERLLTQQSTGVIDEDQLRDRLQKLTKELETFTKRKYSIELAANADKARLEIEGFFKDIRTESERLASEAQAAAEREAASAARRAADAAERAIKAQVAAREKAESDAAKRLAVERERLDKQAAQAAERIAARSAAERARQEAKALAAAARETERAAKEAAKTLEREVREAARKAAAEAEKAFGETFAGRVRKGIISGFSKLPDLTGFANLDEEAESVRKIREELRQLSSVRIGVDMDDADFQVKLADILEKLRRIRDNTAEVDVRADTSAAVKELSAVLALTGIVDGRDVEIDVKADTSSARREMTLLESVTSVNLSRLQNLIALGGSIGLAIVPAAAAAASAIGFVGTAALAAGSGIGVMVLGFQGVFDAVKALNKAQLDAEKTTKSLGKSSIGVANAADSIASAERGLAAARQDAAEASRRAAKAVADAERDVGDARREAAQAAEAASRAVLDAQRELGRAERDARDAREELTQSYVDAKRAYEDLTSSIKANSLSERQSILDVAEAKEALDKIIANPRATQEEREQAAITYEREVLQLEDVRRRRVELADEQAKANAKGLEGSDEVTRARDRLAVADQRVADAARTLGDALREQNQERLDSARSIADAEARLGEARIQQDIQSRKSADSLASATQALVSAQRQLESAYLTSAAAGGDALENLNEAMAALSPTAREFARYIFSLKDEFLALKFAASDGMLSGLQTAIQNVMPGFEGLRGFIADVSDGIGELFVRFSQDLQNPTFQKFFDYIRDSAVPSMDRLYTISSNLTEGLINLFLAFTPFNEDVGGGLESLTERFRVWSETLDQNQGFQKFLAYVQDNAPKVWNLLTETARFLGDVVHAAAPIGTIVVDVFTKMFEWINKIPQPALTAIIGALSGIALGLTILGAATAAYALGTAGAIVAAVGTYIGAIAVLYAQSETFRNVVQTVFSAIATGVIWLWESAIKPAAEGISTIFRWLGENVIFPIAQMIVTYFGMIGAIWADVYKRFIEPYVTALASIFKAVLFPIFQFLWEHVVKPVFENIVNAFNVLKAVVGVVFGLLQIAFKILGTVITFFYNTIFKPIFDKLGEYFTWLADVVQKHVAPKLEQGLSVVGKIFEKLKDYARIPIKFIIETVINDGLLAGYNKLAKTFNVKPDDVRIPIPQGFATGGILPGFTPGRDVHTFVSPTGGALRLSGGEGIMRPELTRALGSGWLNAGNKAARAGGTAGVRSWLMGDSAPRGRAGRRRKRGEGDGLGDLFNWAKDKAKGAIMGIADLISDPVGGLRKLGDDLFKLVPGIDSDFGRMITSLPKRALEGMIELAKSAFGLGKDPGGADLTDTAMGGGNTLGGVAGMMKLLHKVFPGLRLISGLRPGDRVPTGGLSYHGFNRAVDLPAMREVAIWIRQFYGKGTRELITPWRDLDLWNGRNTHYDDAIHNAHNFAGGNAHVHWAYDSGGIMPPGYGRWYNGTGKPEAVLTNEQWNNVSRLVGHVEGRMDANGNTYNFQFRDSTLDAARLRAMQNRDDTYMRLNRAG